MVKLTRTRCWKLYLITIKQFIPVNEACKISFRRLQLFLVNEVQKTYLSQGVEIADKHIEVIVKQMTSKVRVSYGG